MRPPRCLLLPFAVLAAALVSSGQSQAAGGNYVFDGGSRMERNQVRAALNASVFDWSLVQAQITVHILRGIPSSKASPGQIWLDADLLDAAKFSWGVVQHEYAHQVDFSLFDAATRASLLGSLGGEDWCYGVPGLAHDAYGCERFASTLAWAYWPAKDNAMAPESRSDESAAMAPAKFRALMSRLIGFPDPLSARRISGSRVGVRR